MLLSDLTGRWKVNGATYSIVLAQPDDWI